MQELVALASDLGLDSLPCCAEGHRWSWFRRYCMASRVASSLINRLPFPMLFCEEVRKKIQEMTPEYEGVTSEHEDNLLFTQEHDVQLLLWINRLGLLIRCIW